MPNHCFNVLTVRGPEYDIDVFQRSVVSNDTLLDFEYFIAMPEELRHTVAPNDQIDALEQQFLIDLHGAIDWYDWSIENWGTKWNAYRIKVTRKSPSELQYTFNTANNSINRNLLAAIISKHPNLEFELRYIGEVMEIFGHYWAKNPNIIRYNPYITEETVKKYSNVIVENTNNEDLLKNICFTLFTGATANSVIVSN